MASQAKRRFRVTLTDSNHDLPIAPNRLRELKVTRRDAVWVADITYVDTGEGWLYVAGRAGPAHPALRGLGHG
jgi:transposase InsO family protein